MPSRRRATGRRLRCRWSRRPHPRPRSRHRRRTTHRRRRRGSHRARCGRKRRRGPKKGCWRQRTGTTQLPIWPRGHGSVERQCLHQDVPAGHCPTIAVKPLPFGEQVAQGVRWRQGGRALEGSHISRHSRETMFRSHCKGVPFEYFCCARIIRSRCASLPDVIRRGDMQTHRPLVRSARTRRG